MKHTPDQFSESVVVYTTNYCAFCQMAKRLLSHEDIPFAEHRVDGDAEARDWLVEQSGQRTVPQIFIHGRSIGGFQELQGLHRSGQLESLLNSAP